MSHTSRHRSVGGCLFLAAVLALAVPSPQAFAQEITGPWEMTMSFGGRPSYATLTISRNADGSLAGKWGSSELSNVRFAGHIRKAGNHISFPPRSVAKHKAVFALNQR